MNIAILDAFTADQGDPELWAPLSELGAVQRHERTPAVERARRCDGVSAVLTNKVVVDAELMEALPDLRYIGVLATGYNVVDIDAARARGIAVTNVPGYSTESVAQHVMALLLAVTNDVAGHATRVRAGEWASSADFCFFTKTLNELAGRTFVIIGKGAIGGAVARLAQAFGMRIIAAQVPGRDTTGRAPLAEAIAQADVISLHCPLTAATEHLVNGEFCAGCKTGAILINTGRGGLIDQAAVAAALDAGQLSHVCLDVLDAEPPAADHVLTPRADVTITPHVAWGTLEARQRLIAEAAANLSAFVAGERRNRVDL